jgi:hypothetical protein
MRAIIEMQTWELYLWQKRMNSAMANGVQRLNSEHFCMFVLTCVPGLVNVLGNMFHYAKQVLLRGIVCPAK